MIYTYVGGKEYLRYKVVSIQNNVATLIMMEEGSSSTIQIKVKKQSSYEPAKKEVSLSLDYNFVEKGNMSRATGSEVYTSFYNSYIKTKVLTPTTYEITFTNNETGATATFDGKWGDNALIRLTEGEYTVTGKSYPIKTYATDSLKLKFDETIKITQDMTKINLTAINDSYLLIFNGESVSSAIYYYGSYSGGSTSSIACANKEDVIYMFMKDLFGNKNTVNVVNKNGNKASINISQMPFEVGKYYFFDNVTGSFDVPPMEGGN